MIIETMKYQNWDLNYIFEYFIQDGELWYKYDDITYIIGLGYQDYKTNDIYKKFINENEKCEVEIKDKYGNPNKAKFINSIGHYRLLERNEKYIRAYRLSIINFEKEVGFVTVDDYNSHCTKTLINNLEQAIMHDNDEHIKSCSKALINSPKLQQLKNSVPIKEEIIDKFRDDIYDCEDEFEVSWNIKMKKKDNPNEVEERKALYRKHKGQESICPSWIKDIIK